LKDASLQLGVSLSDLSRMRNFAFRFKSLEDLKAKQTQSMALNSELRLEIEGLRDPRRIDVIARRQLGLTQPMPTQVQEYDAPSGAEVAAARYVRSNHE